MKEKKKKFSRERDKKVNTGKKRRNKKTLYIDVYWYQNTNGGHHNITPGTNKILHDGSLTTPICIRIDLTKL